MADIYRLPAVSPTMETGHIVGWRLQVGEAFTAGAVIVEVGTDKATMEAEIFEDGVLLAQLVEAESDVPVDAPIAVFGEAGEDASALIAQATAELTRMRAHEPVSAPSEAPAPSLPPLAAPSAPPTPVQSTPSASSSRPVPASPTASLARTWQGRELPSVFSEPPGDIGFSLAKDPAKASPAARRLATELGVALDRLTGSGPHGRIVRADIEAHASSAPTAAPARERRLIKLTPMRKTIAKRLTEVHQSVPSFTLNASFDVSALVALRKTIKAVYPDDSVSYNDLMCVAIARALQEVPAANASWTDQGIIEHGQVDLGLAVAVDQGLVTPIVRDAASLSARAFAASARELAQKARDGKLKPEEYQGNTFTVSNLGMFGITRFTAILNPPASAILALGAFEQRPVVLDGALGVGWRVDAVLTCDHRVIDGAVGARFLQILRHFVEAPALIGV